LVVAFLIGCAILLGVGCAGTSSETSNKKEQGSSPQATASEEARCQGTSTNNKDPRGGEGARALFTTNDIPGCPKGGLLLGTDKLDFLNGEDGDDVIRGLGRGDDLLGGSGDDVIYAGPGGDSVYADDPGNDVIYGGDGNDFLWSIDGQRDKVYGGKGKDRCTFDKLDYVDSSCEQKRRHMPQV
jgi:Ca2+-binding RTX toxin-like protein